MATSFAQNVTKGLNNILAGNWAWIDVANGFRSGYGTVNSFGNLSSLNARIQDISVTEKSFLSFAQSFIQSSWKITRTAIKAHRLAPTLPLLARNLSVIKYTAAGWIGMNFFAYFQHATNRDDGIENTLFGSVWENTPYALLLTNIALTALELRVNFTKAAISFVSMGISYLDVQRKPQNRSYVWNWVCPIAARSLVLYYGNNWQRAMIGIDIATSTAKLLFDRRR